MSKIVDGIYYEDETQAPDLGSWTNVAEMGSITKSYRGHSKDFDKLPTVSQYPQYEGKLVSGSLAIACDTKESKMYERSMDAWL